MKKMPVDSSNLALRFYLRNGWTKDLLDSCCKYGQVKNFHPEDPPEWAYFTLDHTVNSSFDIDKLMEHVSEVRRTFNDHPNDTDREFIERMNW